MMRFACALVVSAVTAGAQITLQYASVAAPDGVQLKASYYSPGKPGPGVLLLHQCNRDRFVWNDLAAQLAASGIHVLTFDMRGFGESPGERFGSLTREQNATVVAHWPADIDAAYQFLLSQPGVDKTRIGVGGASCGVNNAIQTARRHPEVKTLVLLSGNTDEAGRAFLQASHSLPVFISASEDDGETLPYMRWLFSFSHDPRSQLIPFQAAGHGADMFRVEKTLPGTIVDWFDKILLQPNATVPNSPVVKPSADEQFWNILVGSNGVARARRMLDDALRKDPKTILFPEYPMNLYGYEHLQKGDTKGAIEILKLNEIAYPNSANVYDSLGDAYLADHQDKLALEYSEKCLKVLAEHPMKDENRAAEMRANAQQKIGKLKH